MKFIITVESKFEKKIQMEPSLYIQFEGKECEHLKDNVANVFNIEKNENCSIIFCYLPYPYSQNHINLNVQDKNVGSFIIWSKRLENDNSFGTKHIIINKNADHDKCRVIEE